MTLPAHLPATAIGDGHAQRLTIHRIGSGGGRGEALVAMDASTASAAAMLPTRA